jgi:cyclic-di-GMP-binding protein
MGRSAPAIPASDWKQGTGSPASMRENPISPVALRPRLSTSLPTTDSILGRHLTMSRKSVNTPASAMPEGQENIHKISSLVSISDNSAFFLVLFRVRCNQIGDTMKNRVECWRASKEDRVAEVDFGRDWLASASAAHPLSDVANLERLIAKLSTSDSMAALQSIIGWAEEAIGVPGFSIQHRFALIDLLDRTAKNHQLRLVPQYLEGPRLKKLSESRLWSTSFNFWRVMGEAYLDLMERFQAAEAGGDDFRRNLPAVVGRALRSLTVQLKWTVLRYDRVEERLWRDLGRAYLFAESQGFAPKRSAVYPGSHGESSAREELLKALMMTVSAPDALTPVQQHVAERLVAHFGSRFALHPTPGPGCVFSFDLSMHVPPTRARKGAVAMPMLRYFGPGTAGEGLHELIAHLRHHERLPPGVHIGGDFPRDIVVSVLDHLSRCWADTPVARRGKRRDLINRLTVIPGLVDIHQWLDAVVADAEAGDAPPAVSESWVVSDASDGGYGAVVPAQTGDWLQVGALVGVRGETSDFGRLAILRRLSQDDAGQWRVGMELIGDVAVPVNLFPQAAKNALDPDRFGEPAILVTRHPGEDRAIEMLLRPGAFPVLRELQMRFRDRLHRITFLRTVEHGNNYDRIMFRLL